LSGWPTVRLGEVCEAQTGTRDPRKRPEATFRYIDIASVDNKSKKISEVGSVIGIEAPSRARQVLKENDVIVSMTRPNLNAVALVPRELDDEICSTGFSVLRAKPCVLPSYVFHYVKTPAFISATSSAVAGALYPAITASFLRSLPIPLPPLDEQRRIVGLLDRAAEIMRRADAARAKARAIIPALFLDTFGDPATNPKGWPIVELGDVIARITGGKNIEAGNGTSKYRIMKVSAVTSGIFKAHEAKPAPDYHIPADDHHVRVGDFLFSRANTSELVGAVAIADDVPAGLLLPDKIWRIEWIPTRIEPRYAYSLLRSSEIRRIFAVIGSGTSGSMKNISQAKLVRVPIPLPPLAIQTAFAEQTHRLESLARHLDAAAAKAEAMAAGLSAEVFG
jgi:type I restriction enzyme S subunit